MELGDECKIIITLPSLFDCDTAINMQLIKFTVTIRQILNCFEK